MWTRDRFKKRQFRKAKRRKVIDNSILQKRPSREKYVKVLHGRHIGKEGVVTWHGRSEFSRPKERDIWSAHAIGREGYRVKIKTKFNEEFFVDAEHVEVIQET